MSNANLGRKVTYDFDGIIASTRSDTLNLIDNVIETTTRDDDGCITRMFTTKDANASVEGLITDANKSTILGLGGSKQDTLVTYPDEEGSGETVVSITFLCSNVEIKSEQGGLVEFSLSLEGSGGYTIQE